MGGRWSTMRQDVGDVCSWQSSVPWPGHLTHARSRPARTTTNAGRSGLRRYRVRAPVRHRQRPGFVRPASERPNGLALTRHRRMAGCRQRRCADSPAGQPRRHHRRRTPGCLLSRDRSPRHILTRPLAPRGSFADRERPHRGMRVRWSDDFGTEPLSAADWFGSAALSS